MLRCLSCCFHCLANPLSVLHALLVCASNIVFRVMSGIGRPTHGFFLHSSVRSFAVGFHCTATKECEPSAHSKCAPRISASLPPIDCLYCGLAVMIAMFPKRFYSYVLLCVRTSTLSPRVYRTQISYNMYGSFLRLPFMVQRFDF
mgnify:CR=1 FL=1